MSVHHYVWVFSLLAVYSGVANAKEEELLRRQPLRGEPPSVLPEAMVSPPDAKLFCEGANPRIEVFKKSFSSANPDCFTNKYEREQGCLSAAKSFCAAPSIVSYISLYQEGTKYHKNAPLQPPAELLCTVDKRADVAKLKVFFPLSVSCLQDAIDGTPGGCIPYADRFCADDSVKNYLALAYVVGYNVYSIDDSKSDDDQKDFSPPKKGALGDGFSLSGASWQAALINGLSSFVAKRAKAEVVSWAMDTLQRSLCRAGYLDAQKKYYYDGAYLFRETCANLNSQQARSLSEDLLAQALRDDVEVLPMRVVSAAVSANHKINGELLSFLSELSLAMLKKEGPAELLRSWAKRPALAARCKDVRLEDALPVGCVMATMGLLFSRLEALEGVTINLSDAQSLTLATKLADDVKKELFALYGIQPEDFASLENPAFVAKYKLHPRLKRIVGLFSKNADMKGLSSFVKQAAALQLLLEDWRDRVYEPAPEAYTLQVVDSSLLLYQSGLSLFGLEVSSEAKRMVHRAHDLINGVTLLADLVAQSRAGAKPLELLAGLGRVDLLRAQCAKYEPSKYLPVGCALATLGLMVEHFGVVVRLEDDSVARPSRLSQLSLNVLYEDLLYNAPLDASFKSELLVLYGLKSSELYKLPAPLAALFEGKHLGQLRSFLLSLHSLQSQIKLLSADESSDASARLERAAKILSSLSDVLTDGIALLGKEVPDELKLSLQAIDAFNAMASGQYSEGAKLTLELASTMGVDVIPPGVVEQLPLVISLLNAKTPEEVEAALEAAAAPVGGWKSKRVEHVLSVTALVGMLGGVECPVGGSGCPLGSGGAPVSGGGAAGPLGMVGVEYSRTLSARRFGKFLQSSNVAAFASLLDVGQLAWVRVSNTNQPDDPATAEDESSKASIASEVNVAQVFSPGLYLRFGVGRSPFVLGFGGSFAPALRQYSFVSDGVAQDELFSMLRMGAFAAVDLTIFSLYKHNPRRD